MCVCVCGGGGGGGVERRGGGGEGERRVGMLVEPICREFTVSLFIADIRQLRAELIAALHCTRHQIALLWAFCFLPFFLLFCLLRCSVFMPY